MAYPIKNATICKSYTVTISATDINSATGNTGGNAVFNNQVYAFITPCPGQVDNVVLFSGSGVFQNAFCASELIGLYYSKNNISSYPATFSTASQQGICLNAVVSTLPIIVSSNYGAIGVNQGGYGLTSSTGFWNGKSPDNRNGTVVYVGNGTSTPTMYILNSASDLINLATQLGGVSIVTEYDALNYFNTSTDKLCVNTDYPNIVASGLTLNLDAGFIPSYPKGGTTWKDLSGNANNGTFVNTGPTYDSGNFGSLVFAASNNQHVTGSTAMTLTSGITVSAWFKFTSQPNTIMRFITVGSEIACIRKNGSNAEFFFKAGGSLQVMNYAKTFTNNVWYNMVGVYNNYNAYMYIDGVQLGPSLITLAGALDSVMGYTLSSGVSTEAMVGNIANVMVYNRPLSVTEILQNYYAGLQRFINGNPYTLNLWLDGENTNTRVITPTTAYDMGFDLNNCSLMNGMGLAHREAGTSFSFDGVNNYIDCGSPYHMTSQGYYFSISIWFKLYTTPVGSNTIIKYGATSAGWSIGVSSSGLYYTFYTTAGNYIAGGLGAISLNVWHNVTMTFDYAGAYTLYLDSSVVATSSTYAGNNCNNGGSTIVNIGRDTNSSTNYFKGYMSVIRSYQNLLTANEVLTIYNAGKQRHNL